MGFIFFLTTHGILMVIIRLSHVLVELKERRFLLGSVAKDLRTTTSSSFMKRPVSWVEIEIDLSRWHCVLVFHLRCVRMLCCGLGKVIKVWLQSWRRPQRWWQVCKVTSRSTSWLAHYHRADFSSPYGFRFTFFYQLIVKTSGLCHQAIFCGLNCVIIIIRSIERQWMKETAFFLSLWSTLFKRIKISSAHGHLFDDVCHHRLLFLHWFDSSYFSDIWWLCSRTYARITIDWHLAKISRSLPISRCLILIYLIHLIWLLLLHYLCDSAHIKLLATLIHLQIHRISII